MDVLSEADNRINDAICTITGAQKARKGQINAVRSLVDDKKDTILVAATGYGKSAVLYAFTALTGKITIQIVPLTKLGENQRDDIRKNVPGSNPIWIDAETPLTHRELWDDLAAGVYTHILLSPEQALNAKFKAVLRNPGFQDLLGLFAIDELHMVFEWKTFREKFTLLGSLRGLLPRSLPWFGCTATLDKESQEFIFEHTGFNNSTTIIRTSVDRPEISIVVQPLLRNSFKDYRRLYFLFEGATPATVRDIPKTIIYLDNKFQLTKARHSLLELFKKQGFTSPFARKVIRLYDADVQSTDKDIIFRDFANISTDCRVLVATVSLGMGMDIPDVRRVVQFGLPKEITLSDLWQRFRRAMRKDKSGYGTAYLFAPFYCFDHLGQLEKVATRAVRRAPQPRRGRGGRGGNMAISRTPQVSSRLSEMSLVEQDSDDNASQASSQATADSQASQALQAPQPLTLEGETQESHSLFDFSSKVKLTNADITSRDAYSKVIIAFLNASCFRKYALQHLQEPDDPDLEFKKPVDLEFCCNACNHELGKIPRLPPRPTAKDKPSAGSLAGVALEFLSAWCSKHAQNLVDEEVRWLDIPSSYWMDNSLQNEISRQFSKAKGRRNQPNKLPFDTVEELVAKVEPLRSWEYFDTYSEDLVQWCKDSLEDIIKRWEEDKSTKQANKATSTATESAAVGVVARLLAPVDTTPKRRSFSEAEGSPRTPARN